jgi:hypothetical protein
MDASACEFQALMRKKSASAEYAILRRVAGARLESTTDIPFRLVTT